MHTVHYARHRTCLGNRTLTSNSRLFYRLICDKQEQQLCDSQGRDEELLRSFVDSLLLLDWLLHKIIRWS